MFDTLRCALVDRGPLHCSFLQVNVRYWYLEQIVRFITCKAAMQMMEKIMDISPP